MPWARIDDRANSDAKLLALSDSAYRLWVCGLIFCQANLTDGFIPRHAVETFGVRARHKDRLIDELTRSVLGKRPLWQSTDDGWIVNDFLDWNDSRDTILKKRTKGKDRVDRFRARLNGVANNADSNALQTANERELFAASTTTTKDQEPKGPRAVARPARAMARMADVASHLQAAAHAYLDAHPEASDGDLREEVKATAARLSVCDYDGRSVATLVDGVLGRRARRLA